MTLHFVEKFYLSHISIAGKTARYKSELQNHKIRPVILLYMQKHEPRFDQIRLVKAEADHVGHRGSKKTHVLFSC